MGRTRRGTELAEKREAVRRSGRMPDAMTQSKGFRLDREARRQVLTEDYVELIADLLEKQSETLQIDIAGRLGVSQPTVAKVLQRLTEAGLVGKQANRKVMLTEAGWKMAAQIRRRHDVVEAFLHALGISEEQVRIDAEGIEHYVSDETLAAFDRALSAGIERLLR